MQQPLRLFLLTLFFALISAAAFPPLGWWPLSLVGCAGLLWILRDLRPTYCALLGFQYGFLFGLATMYWMHQIFDFLFVGLVMIFAGYFALFGLLVGLTRDQRPIVRAALTALFAVGIEWLRGDAWDLRFPWYTVPHALAQAPTCIAFARWLGTYGLSLAIWFVAALGALGPRFAWAGFLLLPLGGVCLPDFEKPDRQALLVQNERKDGMNALLERLDVGQAVDLAVLPEYAYFADYRGVLKSAAGPHVLARKLKCPVVFGAIDGNLSDEFQNVAVVLAADGSWLGNFPKQRTVPLLRDGTAGATRPVFPLDQGTLGVAVCYDFDSPAIVASLIDQGATAVAAPNYDALHWGEVQHIHHELLFRLRAVEADRWILRASSSGRSESIDPHGQPSLEGIAIGEVGSVVLAFGHRTTKPLGARLAILGPLAALGSIVGVGFLVVGRRRQQPSAPEPPGKYPGWLERANETES